MHITEGIITGWPAAAYTVGALGLMGAGARRMRRFAAEHPDKKPLLGMAGAFVFFISLLPLPSFAGTCSHPCGSPLAGILLGPWIGIALAGLSLFLQAAFFAHGGFSTWGANLVSLGCGGALGGWLAFRLARRAGCPLWLAGALGGLMGDVLTYLLAGLSLSGALVHAPAPRFTFGGYLAAVYAAYLPIQAPLALGEMLVTGLALHYIHRQRPAILESLQVMPRPARAASVAPIALLLIAAWAAPLAAAPEAPAGMAGMDEAVNERLAEEAGRPPRAPYLDTEAMGDVWNFILLGAGAACGFVVGRWWHLLFGRAPGSPAEKKEA